MKLPISLVLLIVLFLTASCGPSSLLNSKNPPDGIAQDPVEEVPSLMYGTYCTTIERKSMDRPIRPQTYPVENFYEMVCLNEDGHWVRSGGEIHRGASCSVPDVSGFPIHESYSHPQLFVEGDEVHVGIERCPRRIGYEHVILRLNLVTGHWSEVSSVSQLTNEIYSQFGASYFQWNGSLFTLWSQFGDAQNPPGVVTMKGSSTTNFFLGGSSPILRHLNSFRGSMGQFIYQGEPSVEAFQVSSNGLSSLGTVPPIQGERALYTSMTQWNRQLVMAYSSTLEGGSWATSTAHTRVAFYDFRQNAWTLQPGTLEDTSGHDGIRPFVFVIQNQLFAMIPDFTTDGVPSDSQGRIPFRFRVKVWNPTQSIWSPVGKESMEISISPRFEFLQDGDRVLFGAYLWNPSRNSFDRKVIQWRNGQFSSLGESIETVPMGSRSYRPGAVIAFPAN